MPEELDPYARRRQRRHLIGLALVAGVSLSGCIVVGEGYVRSRYFAHPDGRRAVCSGRTFGGIGAFPGVWLDSLTKEQRSVDQCAEQALIEGYGEIDEKTYLAKGGYVR